MFNDHFSLTVLDYKGIYEDEEERVWKKQERKI